MTSEHHLELIQIIIKIKKKKQLKKLKLMMRDNKTGICSLKQKFRNKYIFYLGTKEK